MGKTTGHATYVAYRDAIGALMAARRGDRDGLEWLMAFEPSLKGSAVDALIAVGCGLMREIERMGGEPDELVARWANNVARREAEK